MGGLSLQVGEGRASAYNREEMKHEQVFLPRTMAELVNHQTGAEVHLGQDAWVGRREWTGHALPTTPRLSVLLCEMGIAVAREAVMPAAWSCLSVSGSEHTPVRGTRGG